MAYMVRGHLPSQTYTAALKSSTMVRKGYRRERSAGGL